MLLSGLSKSENENLQRFIHKNNKLKLIKKEKLKDYILIDLKSWEKRLMQYNFVSI